MVLPGSANGLTATGSQFFAATILAGGGYVNAKLGTAIG